MENVIFLTAASALGLVSSLPAHEYHFVYELKNWTEAQSYCREMYTDLATVEDMEDVKMLNNVADLNQMNSASNYLAWIGLYDDLNSWRWSMSDPNFYQHDMGFRNWATVEPNNYGGKESCGGMSTDGTWNDYSCSTTFPSVCFYVTGMTVKFIYISTNMNWTDAQSYCRQHHTDLASVRNQTENTIIKSMIPSGQAWFGFYRIFWNWVDGTNSSFRFWNNITDEPNGPKNNCAVANFLNSGMWEAQMCDIKAAFVCYSGPFKKVVRLKLVRSSSVDLNDPVVLEDLLKQLKQKLKDQGVTGFIKLNWRKSSDGQIFHEDDEETDI